ncbi:very short patch repair endonuclease [Achromobacter spanius]|uniref:very short patch repair endonuclease n=1 Tax=Achromobacter spanius TaxID=217203 RepID=UPI003805C218
MTDSLSREARSQRMSLIKGKNTKPEMIVRRLLHGAGYRYRLHDKKLAGKPDLVFASRRKIIFINGCFWHRHCDCALARMPKSNQAFWTDKLASNKARDEDNWAKLVEQGWAVLVVWECELRDMDTLIARIRLFLDTPLAA